MINKIGFVKITVGAALIILFGAAAFFTQTYKISAYKTSAGTSQNSQNCAACHQSIFSAGHQNIHRQTVRQASPETVRGDFERENNLEYDGAKIEMRRDGADYTIKIGAENYKIAAVVGVKYIEQYVGEKEGELHSLPIGYDLQGKRWIHLNETDFAAANADSARHLQNWKTDCAACHQTGAGDFSGDFGDAGISCAACHGDTSEHLTAKNSVWAKIGFETDNKIVNPVALSSDASLMICAQCHARELKDTPPFAEIAAGKSPVEYISAHRQNDENLDRYWSDGSNKFSGNEFQSIVRSVCYVQSKSGGHGIEGEKINCASCHSPHKSGDEKPETEKSYNQNCINCHSQFSDDAAIAEHTKHQTNSEASNCVSCHLPETVYGRMRFERTHEISVPNPVLTVEKQVPNACNLCHTDKSVNWAITANKKLWSERFRTVEISPDKRFDQPEAFRLLSSDDEFLRALAAESLRKHPNKQ